MSIIRLFVTSVFAAGLLAAPANATTFIFKSGGAFIDMPTGNVAMDCGTVGADLCTDDDTLGFDYSKDGVSFNASAYQYTDDTYASRDKTLLIQDISPENSGLGAFSENDLKNDQTQFNSLESIEFVFNETVSLTNFEFNAGDDLDCSSGAHTEGPCGDFELWINGALFATITAVDLLTDVFTGMTFEFRAITPDAGFAIAQFEVVNEVPIPGAIPLFLAGMAWLRFSSRRRKKNAS
ncbi:hypothetical protein PUV54_13115 [Hyphococcus flavus]|uniref:VPLPA-CTERM sorting domain-containing protein n=1 Tax=Hyphococcus flavus TaxID=1866326 RepID=A0AAE9ZAR0_9PROT|nr:hypothetical protein [Hyphococcus flavus]WDI30894.1 hypothetical protein PUV54_13115 [Hyphococcus flavus]